MPSDLLLAVSQEENRTPYTFRTTGINVFSIEEALYHCFNYWERSADEFTRDDFIRWVNDDLGLSFVAARLREISEIADFPGRTIAFLSVVEYFDQACLRALKKEIARWEKRNEWEKYKDAADALMNAGEPEKAYALYGRALSYMTNVPLLNNAAVALMKQGAHEKAAELLGQALELEPGNERVLFAAVENFVLWGRLSEAEEALERAGQARPGEVLYFKGEILFAKGDFAGCVPLLNEAVKIDADPHYVYALSEVYVKQRRYEKALETIGRIEVRDKYFMKRQAELFVKADNVPAAVKCIEKALLSDNNDVDLWTRLAMYHRVNYDLTKALGAAQKAVSLAPDNRRAGLELARVRKAQGRIKDYQVALNRILSGFKNDYREMMNVE